MISRNLIRRGDNFNPPYPYFTKSPGWRFFGRMRNMIKAIIFDIGGVVLPKRIEEVYLKLVNDLGIDNDSFEDFRKNYDFSGILKGEDSIEKFLKDVEKKFSLEVNIIEKWKKIYVDSMPIDNEVVNVIKKLKKNYITPSLSNTSKLHAEINRKRGVFSYFQPALNSCDLGLMKPEKEIYNLILDRLNLKPEECIFIDDRESHIDSAKKLGFKTILFKDSQQLLSDLNKNNIKLD